jgi:hypothetical protein
MALSVSATEPWTILSSRVGTVAARHRLWDVDAPHRLRPVAPGVNPCGEVLEVGLHILLIVRHRDPIDSRTCLPLLTPERPFERFDINVVQQRSEPCLGGRAGRRVHRSEVGWQGDPGSVSGPALPRAGSFRAGPFSRRASFPSTASSVLLPTSAWIAAAASPRHDPPPETTLAERVGPLMFRRMLFMRDPAVDPGGETPSRVAMADVLLSRKGTLSASAIFHLSRLICAPRMTPVYASNPASPRRPQNSRERLRYAELHHWRGHDHSFPSAKSPSQFKYTQRLDAGRPAS